MSRFDQWIRTGDISFEQAEGMAVGVRPYDPRRPRVAEALTYFGAVAIAIATLLLAFDDIASNPFALFLGSGDFIKPALITLVGAAIVFGMGWWLADEDGPFRRAARFALLVGFVLGSIGWSLLLVEVDLGDFTPLMTSLPIVALALTAYGRAPGVPTQIALFSGSLNLISALLVLFQVVEGVVPSDLVLDVALGGAPAATPQEPWAALLVGVVFGLAWMWLGLQERLRTRNAALLLGAGYAWIEGIQLFEQSDGWIVVSVIVAAAFVVGAVGWRSSVLATFATVATLVLIAQVIAITADDPSVGLVAVAYGVPGLLALAVAWDAARTSDWEIPAEPDPVDA